MKKFSKNSVRNLKRKIIPHLPGGGKKFLVILAVLPFAFLANYLILNLRPVSDTPAPQIFDVSPGNGFKEIVSKLEHAGLIRNPIAFKTFAFFTGSASNLKPGRYELSPHWSGDQIIRQLVLGSQEEIEVIIGEGATIFDVDRILAAAGVIKRGELINFKSDTPLEGRLFPDTYKFFIQSEASNVVQKFLNNFEAKVVPVLSKDPENFEDNLILASLVEKEVPFYEDRKIVAGILKKREKIGMALQVDATICYLKAAQNPLPKEGCWPLTKLDFETDSPYNTYLYKGLPPGPISSPGLSAVEASLEARVSPYWFYISDPETLKTIFAENLDEHLENISIYLRR